METTIFASQLVQPIVYQQESPASQDTKAPREQIVFHKLLAEAKQLVNENQVPNQGEGIPQAVSNQLLQWLKKNNLDLARLHGKLLQHLDTLDFEQPYSGDINESQELVSTRLIEWLALNFPDQHKNVASEVQDVNGDFNLDQISPEQQIDESQVMNQINQLLLEVHRLLNSVSPETDLTAIAPKVLQLLEEWTAISSHTKDIMQPFLQDDEDPVHNLWRELIQIYEKRTTFNTKQLYHAEAEVTTKDVAKWLNQLMVKQTQETDTLSHFQQINQGNTAVSNIGTYMLHINQASTTPMETQLLEQFQQVIRMSQLLANPNGNQLVIALQPENLGDMVVRLTEINGELTLKIITTSQVTRQMLEANIHELRNMFAPSQVTIERQDLELSQVQQQLEEEFVHEQEQDQPEQQHEQEQDSDQNKFIEALTSLLMSEKV